VEFEEVVRRRKMVRTFRPDPVHRDAVEAILGNALHAPSAGYTQGYAFMVLEGRETKRFWEAVSNDDQPGWLAGVRTAPLLVVPLASKQAYLDRYAEPDKGWADRDESRWPVPYWYVDTAFASLLMLLTAVDEGLGALFFGLASGEILAFRAAFGVPEEYEPIGAIAIGYAGDDTLASSARRGRKPLEEVVHRSGW
jgi:nitroreductase